MRIISLVPSHTEILFALGLGRQLVGVTAHCDYPPQALSIPRVGAFAVPDVARIISLQPDLVLAGGSIHKHCAEELRRAGLRVFGFEPQTVSQLFSGMERIVQYTRAGEAGSRAVATLKSELNLIIEITLNRPRPKVVFVMGGDTPPSKERGHTSLSPIENVPQIMMTPGPACCQYDALRLAGAALMPLAEKISYFPITWQDVIDYDPEIILSCGRSPGEAPPKRCPGCNLAHRPCTRDAASIINNPLLAQVTAVKAGRVHTIPCHFLCRTGPRMLKGMQRLVMFLDPGHGISNSPTAPPGQNTRLWPPGAAETARPPGASPGARNNPRPGVKRAGQPR